MRPRRMCRGERELSGSGLIVATVRFNAATANGRGERRLLRSLMRRRAMLQCGHGDDAVENPSSACSCTAYGAGLQCGHGEMPWRTRATDSAVLDRRQASMRPRRCCRGERREQSSARGTGRRFNAATAMMPWRTCIVQRVASGMSSFNAATAMSPWRTASDSQSRRHGGQLLQCGHGMMPWRTVRTAVTAQVTQQLASMRPRR